MQVYPLRVGAFILLTLLVLPTSVTAQTMGSSTLDQINTQAIRGYRIQSSELRQKIQALDSASTTAVTIPVLFGIGTKDISPNFGDPRSEGRTHAGEDIMGLQGTPIVSPTHAVVIRIGSGAREGISLYTANPGGETFVYMHLDRVGEGVTEGTVLEPGSLIGYVGNTGNASGGAAHLHFEIHNTEGTPTDPFPRLTSEFSLSDKMVYLTKILSQSSDAPALARTLVTNFRSTFSTALASGIALPQQIVDAMNAPQVVPVVVEQATSTATPVSNLELGSTGSAVVALQTYLIQTKVGPAAVRLAQAGATGSFGPMTQAALIEFQLKAGITPATGYYGAITRAYIASGKITSAPTTPPVATTTPTSVLRDLQLESIGEDVRLLQKALNGKGYAIATTGAGSSGKETTYFGPATKLAVIAFQKAKGINPTAGYVGPVTRKALGL